MCYQTQVRLLAAQKPIIRGASVTRKESCFNQKSQRSGEKVDSCPETNSKDSVQPRTFLKGKMEGWEESQWVIRGGGWILHRSPLHADWLSLSSDVILPVWSACRIAKGAVRHRELVINYLIFHSYFFLSRERINRLGKAWCTFRKA